jgi:hypothetical protein
MTTRSMKASVFAVANEPFCIWEHPLDTHNLDFLRGIDAEYFAAIGRMSSPEVQGMIEDEHRGATVARLALHQGVETLFSLLAAMLQAPKCVYAWLANCSNSTLREIVSGISNASFDAPMQLQGPSPTWRLLASFILEDVINTGDIHATAIKGFGELWAKLAHDFVDPKTTQEYNSLKHGFRVAPGGFKLEISGPFDALSAPTLIPLGGSIHGVSYFHVEKIAGEQRANRSIVGRLYRRNWSAQQTILLLGLVSYSLRNVISRLQQINEVPADRVKYYFPSEEDFAAPWKHSVGLVGMDMNRTIPDWAVRATTKQELNELLRGRRPSIDEQVEQRETDATDE